MRQEGFTRIGQTAATVTRKSPPEAGSSAGQTAVAVSPDATRVAAWLARHSVADMDKAAVLRASSLGVGLEVRYEGRYPSGPNGERLPSYQVAVSCDIHGNKEAREAALTDLLNFQTPAPQRAIEEWLAELSVTTASRQKDGMEQALALGVYSSRLGRYPADVVKEALLVKRWKWWPTWDELEGYCEAKASPRRHMIAALQKPPHDPAANRRPPTQEERDRVQAMVDEMFPSQSADDRKLAVDIALEGNCMMDDA